MGPGVPYAIAAKFAHPDRPVIALVGDGAMQMNGINELITIAKYWQRWSDPRLVVLVLNNHDLNQVTWEQRAMEGDPKFEASQDAARLPVRRATPSCSACAGIRVDEPDEVGAAWDEALAADRPVRARGDHRPRGAAAAAAHHARAGEGASRRRCSRGDPDARRDDHGSRSSRRSRSSCPGR